MLSTEALRRIVTSTRGRVTWDAPLRKYTWLQVGGPTPVLFFPADEEDLALFLSQYPHRPFILGAGSNMLIRDGGVREVVIKLGKGFYDFQIHGDQVEVGAGLLDRVVAERCQAAGIAGLEFLFTIPGTMGGALKMNAGCYGHEIQDIVVRVWVMDPKGGLHQYTQKDLEFGYRHCSLPEGWIFVKARLQGVRGDPLSILKRMEDFAHQRRETQPIQGRTGGSTFMNPPGSQAWKLVEEVGYRGRRLGQAQISEKHCNFLLNLGGATAEDLETLGEEARAEVFRQKGIDLQWEILRWGFGNR